MCSPNCEQTSKATQEAALETYNVEVRSVQARAGGAARRHGRCGRLALTRRCRARARRQALPPGSLRHSMVL